MDATDEKIAVASRVVFRVGNDISTDAIYPGRFMATVLPTETPQYAFADSVEFNARLRKGEFPEGSVIVAGSNFGCGSSREQAASALKGQGLTVIAKSFARIFLQNAINLGLRTVICPEIEASEGDELQLMSDSVVNVTTGQRFVILPLPPTRQAIMDAGGLIAYTRARLLRKAEKGA